MPTRMPGQSRDGRPSPRSLAIPPPPRRAGPTRPGGGNPPRSAADGEAVDGDRRAAEGGLDREEGGFQGEEGGGTDGQAAVGLLDGSGGPQRRGRVHPARQPRERPRLVRVHQRRPGTLGAAADQQGDVAVGAEEVGEGLADGVEAGAAELAAVAGLQALAEGAGAAAGAEGLFQLGQLAVLADLGGGGDLVGDGDHGGGGGQGVRRLAAGQALGQVEDGGTAGAGGLVGEQGRGLGQAAVAGGGGPGGLSRVEAEVVAEGGGQLGQRQADERQDPGPGGNGADQGLGAADDQDEDHPGGRLLEHLEEGVGGGLGHPVRLVEDEHADRGLVVGAGGLLADGPDVLDKEVVALGDDHVDVGVDAPEDPPAGVAGAVATGRAVQGGGEHPGGVELADPGRAGEQPGVGDPLAGHGLLEHGHGLVVADHRVPDRGVAHDPSRSRSTGAPPWGSPHPSRPTGAPPWGSPDPSRGDRTAAWTLAATSGTGGAASTTQKRAGSAAARSRNADRTRRWKSSSWASIRSRSPARRASPAAGSRSSRTTRSGRIPAVANRLTSVTGPRPSPRAPPWQAREES